MMQTWDKLYRYLVVKHQDMVVKKENADGTFTRTPDGFGAAPTRPGYPTDYWRRVVEETGKRYEMK